MKQKLTNADVGARPYHINVRWDLFVAYTLAGAGNSCAGTLPRNLEGVFKINGMKMVIFATHNKPNRLYRCYVDCPCGRRFPFAKMGQHEKACAKAKESK